MTLTTLCFYQHLQPYSVMSTERTVICFRNGPTPISEWRGNDGSASASLLMCDSNHSVLHQQGHVCETNEMTSYTVYGHDNKGTAITQAFNGQLQNLVPRLYSLGNGTRLYSPLIMRFYSPDRYSPFDAGGLNAYAYCENDPVNKTDPSGHWPTPNTPKVPSPPSSPPRSPHVTPSWGPPFPDLPRARSRSRSPSPQHSPLPDLSRERNRSRSPVSIDAQPAPSTSPALTSRVEQSSSRPTGPRLIEGTANRRPQIVTMTEDQELLLQSWNRESHCNIAGLPADTAKILRSVAIRAIRQGGSPTLAIRDQHYNIGTRRENLILQSVYGRLRKIRQPQ